MFRIKLVPFSLVQSTILFSHPMRFTMKALVRKLKYVKYPSVAHLDLMKFSSGSKVMKRADTTVVSRS